MAKTFYKTRLRPKGQITVPPEIRSLLEVGEGDDLLFSTDENGRVLISRAQVIPPDQAWFWTERWQQMEREAEADHPLPSERMPGSCRPRATCSRSRRIAPARRTPGADCPR